MKLYTLNIKITEEGGSVDVITYLGHKDSRPKKTIKPLKPVALKEVNGIVVDVLESLMPYFKK